MATPTSDEMTDAVAEDVASGVKSATTGDQTTTLETPTERLDAIDRIRKSKAARRGFAGLVRVSRSVPPGSDPG